MRTITKNIYNFSELTDVAKETAIEHKREEYYNFNEFGQWAIDDCSLFEPLQTELDKIGYSGRDMMIGNSREKIYFDTDRGSYLDCQHAMIINDEKFFYKWLGIDEEYHEYINYSINTPSYRGADTTIEFELENEDVYSEEELEDVFENAKDKFDEHIQDVLIRINNDIDYRFTDEAIIEDIECNGYEFNEDGTIY